jgi:hypothetical protein
VDVPNLKKNWSGRGFKEFSVEDIHPVKIEVHALVGIVLFFQHRFEVSTVLNLFYLRFIKRAR